MFSKRVVYGGARRSKEGGKKGAPMLAKIAANYYVNRGIDLLNKTFT